MSAGLKATADGIYAILQAAGVDIVTFGLGAARPFYTNTTTISTSSSFTYNPVTHGQVCLVTLTNAITVTMAAPTNIIEGAAYKFIFKAGDGASRSFAWNSAYKFPFAASAFSSGTTNVGALDIITFIGGPANTLIFDGKTLDVR